MNKDFLHWDLTFVLYSISVFYRVLFIISLRGEVWAHKTSLTPTTFYWSACTKPEKWAVIYLCVRGIDFASFCNFSIGFWWYFWFFFSRFLNCSNSVVFFVFLDFWTVPIVQYFGFSIFLNCSNSVVFFVFLAFWTVPIVWYFLFF